MTFLSPFRVFSPFSSTTIIVPREGARPLKVETVKPRAAALKTGQFGLSAEPRPTASKILVKVPLPPPAAQLYVATPQGLTRSDIFEDWLEQAVRRIATQKPGRIAGPFALDVLAPRNARTRSFGPLERPLIEALARARIIRRGLAPEKFSAAYGLGSELSVIVADCPA